MSKKVIPYGRHWMDDDDIAAVVKALKSSWISRGPASARFEKAMAGIWSRTVSRATIDEAPFAYKNHEEIEHAIEPTVEIRLVLKPVYNFKDDSSGGGRRSGRRRGKPAGRTSRRAHRRKKKKRG